jgi:type III secretion protein W
MTDHIEHALTRGAQAAQTGAPRQGELNQVESDAAFEQQVADVGISPYARAKEAFKTLGELSAKEAKRAGGSATGRIKPVEEARQAAQDFHGRNPELDPDELIDCLLEVGRAETEKEVSETVERFFKDPTLRDDAYDFVIDMCTEDSLREKAQKAAKAFRENDRNAIDIQAGRNMTQQAREWAEQGLGSPTELRDLYREIIHSQPSVMELFKLLISRYPYGG